MPSIIVPEQEIDVEVSCRECGTVLEAETKTRKREQWIEVEPCPECLKREREAYEEE